MGLAVDQFFQIPALGVNNNQANLGGTTDVKYYSCDCIWHNQNDTVGSGALVNVVNVIDLETPGKITIYAKNSENQIDSQTLQVNAERNKKNLAMFIQAASGISDDVSSGYGEHSGWGAGNTVCSVTMKYYWNNWLKNLIGENLPGMMNVSFNNSDTIDFYDSIPNYEQYKEFQRNSEIIKTTTQPSVTLEQTDVEPSVEYQGDYAYIGPFKATYSGGTPSIQIDGTDVKWATKKLDGTFNGAQGSSSYVSGQTFYAVLNEATAREMSNIKVDFKLTYTSYKARILLAKNRKNGGQNLMYHAGEQTTETISKSWNPVDVETPPKKLIILKEGENGEKLANVEFKIKKVTPQKYLRLDNLSYISSDNEIDLNEFTVTEVSNNEDATIFKTNNNGKIVIKNVKTHEGSYVLWETKNPNYGYKNMKTSDDKVSISVGDFIRKELDKKWVQFNLQEDTTIKWINQKQLGKFTIHKVGETGENLADVKFIIRRSANGEYFKLKNKNTNQVISEISQDIDITNYNIEYVSYNDEPTVFKTKSDGKITINNLEIYRGSSLKYEYRVIEQQNPNYGYRKMELIEDLQSINDGSIIEYGDRLVKVQINNDTKLTVKNKKELGNIEINKVGEAGQILPNVQFKIQRSTTGGYVKLRDKNGNKVNNITGIATINPNNIASSTEYSVEYDANINNATIFITNQDGKAGIKNLEVNSSSTRKYKYKVYEVSNSNYGYTFEANTTVETELIANQNNPINISNTQALGQLRITKVEEGNAQNKLQNVKFIIKRDGKYLRLRDGNGAVVSNIDRSVIINKNNIANTLQYSVEYVTSASSATRFITNSSGQFAISNLEVYKSGNQEKYTYTIQEIENSNYGFKGNSAAVDVTLTKDRLTEKTINNKKELANIKINKVGQGGRALAGVEFVIQAGTNEYVQLIKQDGNRVDIVEGTAEINNKNTPTSNSYGVKYINNRENATRFKTNQNGIILIKNLEVNKSSTEKYNYTICEVANNIYGYNYEANTSLQSNLGNIQGGQTSEISIPNTQALGNLRLTKVDKDNTSKKLKDVEFLVKIGEDKYIQLIGNDRLVKESVRGTAVINTNNEANETEYKVACTSDSSRATKFVTNDNGQIIINNLEVYSSESTKFKYNFVEIANPHYGYSIYSENNSIAVNTELVAGSTKSAVALNEKSLGGIGIESKVDEAYPNILLEDVEFVLSTDKDVNTYIALYDQNGLVREVKGRAVINSENITNDGEYTVKYVKLDKAYLEYSEEERETLEITVFKTDANGKLMVTNLEVKSKEQNVNYKYRLTEVYNPHYGYEQIDGTNYYETELRRNIISSSESNMTNTQEKIKISGYVWMETSQGEGKATQYDKVYTNTDNSNDYKLTDLYKIEEGILVVNRQSTTKIQVKLRNKQTKRFVKQLPDEFNTETGEYTFTDIKIANLENYEVVFVYDGFKYTTIEEQLDKTNGSKVKEIASERETLNNKFATVKDNSEVIAADGTVNTVEYNKDGHTSTVIRFDNDFKTNVTATTDNAGYNLQTQLDNLKKEPNTQPVYVIDNVNMGIVLREQPKISIQNDIYSALVEFEGYKYNYKYDGRQNYYENKNDDSLGVKFEQEHTKQRYTRTVYASDIQAAVDQGKEIKVSITYKMQVANESITLKVMPKQIINYFDARYDIKTIGYGIDGSTHIATNELEGKFSEPNEISVVEDGQEIAKYKSTVIEFGQEIEATNATNNTKDLYITFDVKKEAIRDLLNSKSTYHNAVEILSYASYYGDKTSEYITDKTAVGSVYAGIDKMSQPGNMELKLIDYTDAEGNKDGTKILDTTDYEDDTASAPSLILEATESRKLSGKVWEDSITYIENNEKLGDGIYKDEERAIQGVTVALHKLNEDGSVGAIAKYSNDADVITETDGSGNYIFGYYDEQNRKHVGILPGKYVIKYTYNNEDYIVGHKNINVNDYKSTIITSEVIKNAFENTSEKWYVVEESNRYSDARDDITLRPEYNPSIDPNITVTNSTYNTVLKVENMNAYTPKMDIGIEFTERNEADALTAVFVKECKNIDFGIVQRPKVDITLEKQITGLEIIAQNGTVIIPKGNPSNPGEEMQYVKTGLDGVVPAEIDPQLLQGAQLNLEYTITVTNNCDKDYLELSYYYYGTGGQTEMTTRVKKVVDYLKGTMVVDMDKTIESGSIWEETNAEDLYNNGYINEDVYNELKEGDYKVFTTNQFEDLGPDEEKTVKLYTTKYLAISDIIIESNSAEIIELSGIKTIIDSIPGNNPPETPPRDPEGGNPPNVGDRELDYDIVKLIITPPTGTIVNYSIYIIATVVTLSILIVGIVIIKKKIIK